MVDEGLVEVIMETVGFGMSKKDAEGFAHNIQSYLKKEGWVKLPGKYLIKGGCLVRLED